MNHERVLLDVRIGTPFTAADAVGLTLVDLDPASALDHRWLVQKWHNGTELAHVETFARIDAARAYIGRRTVEIVEEMTYDAAEEVTR